MAQPWSGQEKMRRAQSRKLVNIAVFILNWSTVNSTHIEVIIRSGEFYTIYSGVKMFECPDFMFAEIISVYLNLSMLLYTYIKLIVHHNLI